MVTLMQFLSRSLHSLSPGLDNELVNTLQAAPSPLGPYLLCTIGSECYFWSPSSHLFPWFGDDDNHCGLRCHIQINCHSSSAISPAITTPAKVSPIPPPASLLPLLEAIEKPTKQHWLICFLVELIQIRCLKTNLVCIVMPHGRASAIDNFLIGACKRGRAMRGWGAANVKWIGFLPVVIQIRV